MKIRTRKPPAGMASASASQSETWSSAYMPAVRTTYGITEVARSSRPRRSEGLAYGARRSRQNDGGGASAPVIDVDSRMSVATQAHKSIRDGPQLTADRT